MKNIAASFGNAVSEDAARVIAVGNDEHTCRAALNPVPESVSCEPAFSAQ